MTSSWVGFRVLAPSTSALKTGQSGPSLLEQDWPELGNGQILVLVGDTAWGTGALTRVSQAEHVSRYPCVGGVGQDRGILETQAE